MARRQKYWRHTVRQGLHVCPVELTRNPGQQAWTLKPDRTRFFSKMDRQVSFSWWDPRELMDSIKHWKEFMSCMPVSQSLNRRGSESRENKEYVWFKVVLGHHFTLSRWRPSSLQLVINLALLDQQVILVIFLESWQLICPQISF